MELTHSKISLLIIDNSLFIRERIRLSLSKFKNIDEIFEANDNRSGLKLLDYQQPDVVLVDAQYTNSNFSEIVGKIKEKKPGAVVVVLTNFPSPTMARVCTEIGANYVFDKTSEFNKIIEVIEKIENPLLASRNGM
jgi:DNA-binding NarL/FixJ family response regulator